MGTSRKLYKILKNRRKTGRKTVEKPLYKILKTVENPRKL